MVKWAYLLVTLASCALVAGRNGRNSPREQRVTLFFSAALEGSLEPCGCSANMRGGLARAATVLREARTEGLPVHYLDCGAGLFPSPELPEAAVAQHERKALAVARALTQMKLEARAPGPADDARGSAFRMSLGLPELNPGTLRFIEAGDERIAIVASGSLGVARALADTARRNGARFVVALLDDSFESARPRLEEARGIDLVIAARPKDALAAEQDKTVSTEQIRLVQLSSKGRSLGRVDLVLRGTGQLTWLGGSSERALERKRLEERIELLRAQVDLPGTDPALKALRQAKLEELVTRRVQEDRQRLPEPPKGDLATLRFVPIEGTIADDPAVAEILKEADRDVGALNLEWAKEHGRDCEPPSPSNPGFVGTVVCGSCHPEALAVWKKTRHPHAYEDLRKVGKQHHLDCIGCHVAGWQQPGGVCRIDQIDDRQEVTCESCHGPGSQHVIEPVKDTIRRADSKDCVGCHDHENSPHFVYETYLEQIKGPGHGLPKPK